MSFQIPLLHEMWNDFGESGNRDFRDDDLAKLIVIGLARLQSCLHVLGETDGIDEHDLITATVLAFEECVDKALTLHFPFITSRETLGKNEPWHFAGRFHQTGLLLDWFQDNLLEQLIKALHRHFHFRPDFVVSRSLSLESYVFVAVEMF
jgi:hypothetical protein